MRLNTETRRRLRAQLYIFVVSIVLVVWLDQSGWLTRIEYSIFDSRLAAVRAESVLPEQIKVVLIDESSLSFMASSLGQFPWPRTVYAQLIEFFQSVGAQAVVFDMLFTEPSSDASGNHDYNLAAASAGFGGAIHAALLTKDIADIQNDQLDQSLPDYVAERYALTQVDGLRNDHHNAFSLPIPIIAENAHALGMVGLDPDDDGIYRRVKLLWNYQGTAFSSLALAPVLKVWQMPAIASAEHYLAMGERQVPVDEGRLLINYYSDYQPLTIASVFQTIDMLHRGDMVGLPLDPFSFENSIVFIGASAIGLEDVKATPFDAKAPGVYIHAAAAGNLLANDMLQPASSWQTRVWVVLFVLLAIGIAFNVEHFAIQIGTLVILPALWWFWTYWQLTLNQQVVLVLPLAGQAIAWSWSFTYLSFTEGASKRRVKKMLTQYVSEEMLNEVLQNPEQVLHAGGGHEETLTILFSDVRGFTKLSESLPAVEVVKLLNCHFGEMAEVIFSNKGTLDKFIGDAIMAFWGAPIKVDNHADLATKAALEMITAIDRVNARLQEQALPTIEIGVGLNTGDVVLGNIGSDRKLDYTVIGDAVNVASRMEGITKMYGVPIVISDATRQALSQPRPCIFLDQVRVKGKTEPSAIFAPLPSEQEDPDNYQHHLQLEKISRLAFEFYRSQEWDAAEDTYRLLELPSLRGLYLSRILEFRRLPPIKNWDGVYTLTTK